MDVKYINPFLDATINVFKEMFEVEINAGKPFLFGRGQHHPWDVSGILGMSGDMSGVVVISLHRVLVKMLLKKSLGEDTYDSGQIADMVGEIVNIISGNAKRGLEDLTLNLSLPAIVLGENHEIRWPKSETPIITIPFTSNIGRFVVNVCLAKSG